MSEDTRVPVRARLDQGLRQAVAFARSAEPRVPPSRRGIATDIVIAAAVLTLSLTLAWHQAGGWSELLKHELAAAVVTSVPLAARRWLPLTAFWVLLLGAIATRGHATDVTFLAIVFAGYSAVAYSRFRGAALLSMFPAAVLVTVAFWTAGPANFSVTPVSVLGPRAHTLPGGQGFTALPAAPWRLTGLVVAASLVLIAVLGTAVQARDRIRRLQAEHEAATRRALEQERARIAGELHDVVTHNVSVMIVQAGAARQVLTESPGAATEALLAVESSGRAAMTELRHLLGLLSPAAPDAGAGEGAPGEGAEVGDGTSAHQDLRPQPGLGQLRPLIDRVSATGLPVELRVGGVPRDLPPGLDLAAFRVVQEALTNVIKHAGKPPTSVRLDYRDSDLVIEVADAGRPIPAVGPAVTAPPVAGGGCWACASALPCMAATWTPGPGRAAGGWSGPGCRWTRPRRARPTLLRRPLPASRPRRWAPVSEAPVSGAPATEANGAPRVVIADDQTLVRGGFRMILGAAGIRVVAEAADGRQAVAVVLRHRPDVVLMDIRMPEMDGLEATRRILAAQAGAGCRIIILTTFDLDQYVYTALTVGASGFLLKDVTPEQLVAAVRLVRSGDALLAPSITRRLIQQFAPRPAAPAAPGDLSGLTPRELEVLRLLARGLSNAELAAQLTLSEATVKTHVARILAKLGLRDRVQAVVLAYETGLTAPGQD